MEEQGSKNFRDNFIEVLLAIVFLTLVVIFVYQEHTQRNPDVSLISTIRQFHQIYEKVLDYRVGHDGQLPENLAFLSDDKALICSVFYGAEPTENCGINAEFEIYTPKVPTQNFLHLALTLKSKSAAKTLKKYFNEASIKPGNKLVVIFPILDRQRYLDADVLAIKNITGVKVDGAKEANITSMKPHCQGGWIPRYEVAHKHFFNGSGLARNCYIQSRGSRVAAGGKELAGDQEVYDWHPWIRTDSICPDPLSKASGEIAVITYCQSRTYEPNFSPFFDPILFKGRW